MLLAVPGLVAGVASIIRVPVSLSAVELAWYVQPERQCRGRQLRRQARVSDPSLRRS